MEGMERANDSCFAHDPMPVQYRTGKSRYHPNTGKKHRMAGQSGTGHQEKPSKETEKGDCSSCRRTCSGRTHFTTSGNSLRSVVFLPIRPICSSRKFKRMPDIFIQGGGHKRQLCRRNCILPTDTTRRDNTKKAH